MKIDEFSQKYLDRLMKLLIPKLKERVSWVSVAELTDDPALFVEAVAALGATGAFDDESGHIRVEFGKDNATIRYVPDWEIEWMYSMNKNDKR